MSFCLLLSSPPIWCVSYIYDIYHFRIDVIGSNCVIILDDANIPHVVNQLVKGITFLNGQWCMGVGRILVQEAIYDEVLKLLLSALKEIQVGQSTDISLPANALGPLAFEEHCHHLKRVISGLIAHGGDAHPTVAVPSDNPCYLSPTIVTGVPHSHCTEAELFGPLATYHRFSTIEEVIGKLENIWYND